MCVSQSPSKTAEGRDAALESGRELEGMDPFQNRKDERREPSLGLGAMVAVMEGRESYFRFQNNVNRSWSMRSLVELQCRQK